MILKKVTFPSKEEGHQKVLFEKTVNGTSINYGTVVLEAGTRFPEEGMTSHPEHEYFYLLEGKIDMIDEEGNSIGLLEPGVVVNIGPDEGHAGFIRERCKILYVMVGT